MRRISERKEGVGWCGEDQLGHSLVDILCENAGKSDIWHSLPKLLVKSNIKVKTMYKSPWSAQTLPLQAGLAVPLFDEAVSLELERQGTAYVFNPRPLMHNSAFWTRNQRGYRYGVIPDCSS